MSTFATILAILAAIAAVVAAYLAWMAFQKAKRSRAAAENVALGSLATTVDAGRAEILGMFRGDRVAPTQVGGRVRPAQITASSPEPEPITVVVE